MKGNAMPPKLDTSNTGLFKRALSRAGTGGGGNQVLFGLSSQLRFREISLEQIEPDPGQPRRDAQGADIATLAASIQQKGLLQPINVREVTADRFRIVAGERRYWAFRHLDRATIPALIVDTDDPQALALIENAQRVDLHPVDLAIALHRLMDDKGLTQEQAALLIGKSQEYVARLIGILKLPAAILDEAPRQGQVSVSLLMELAELGDEAAQLGLWRDGNDGGLTVKTVRDAKKTRRGAVRSPSYEPVFKALRANVAKVRDMKDEGLALAEPHRTALRALRDEIDTLLGA
jgi:ParB family chromosome partitioning protein